jgi:single-strand DNA-binding protein
MAHVAFKGFVGRVHGLKFSNDGKPRFSFSVAEGHRRFNKQTNEWEGTGVTWWSATVFGKQAEDLADVIAEGKKQQVTIAGRSETREYEHNGEKRTSLDVIADHVGLVHRAPSTGQPAQQPGQWGGQQSAGFSAPPQQDPWGGGQQEPAWGATPQGKQPDF